MPERRANDAQVERLLHALKTDLSYRQDLAARIAEKDGIKYASAMRRLQRYITEAGEKRVFTHAPIEKRREVREDYREHERQARERQQDQRRQELVFERKAEQQAERSRRETFGSDEEYVDEGEFETYDVHLNDLRSVIAYHDGDIKETAKALRLSRRGEQLLDFQVRSDKANASANVLTMQGGGAIEDAIRDFLNTVTRDTAQELQDFADIFFNRSDWEIGIILDDLRNGNTTFADWFDAWESDGFDPDATNSEYWRVWREAYKRARA